MDQIGLYFNCQSCLDYVLSNNIQCPNGHQVCQSCFENLSYCPTCHQRVAPSTRIPFLLTTNVDPILNVGDNFDLLLPSLLRLAPAIHPCSADEMIFTDTINNQSSRSSSLMLNSTTTPSPSPLLIDNDNDKTTDDGILHKNNNIADQLLIANSCEVEETLSRLMMLASMSPGAAATVSNPSQSILTENNNPNLAVQQPPPGLMNHSSSKPLPTSSEATNSHLLQQQQLQQQHQLQQKQQVDGFPDFSV